MHETIIRTGITCNKIFCYMHDSASRWLIVENAKIFRSYVKICWIFPRERNCRILIGLCKQVFMNQPLMLLYPDNKTKLVPASLSSFYEKKTSFNLKSVMIINKRFNLSIIKKLIKLFYLNCSCKKVVEKSNKKNLNVIKNTLPNKLENLESLKNNQSIWKALRLMCT